MIEIKRSASGNPGAPDEIEDEDGGFW